MKCDRRALFLLFLFLAMAAVCICVLLHQYHTADQALLAEVYQDGSLIHSYRLDQITEPFTISVTAPNGGCNLITVRPGSIGIESADCPDQICVRQGFISNSLLPVTCLPHRLVILVREP